MIPGTSHRCLFVLICRLLALQATYFPSVLILASLFLPGTAVAQNVSIPTEGHTTGIAFHKASKRRNGCTEASEYYHRNRTNFEISGTAEWYKKWTISIDKTSRKWHDRRSEPHFFASEFLDWHDLDCALDQQGCSHWPSLNYICEKVKDEDLARKVYFAINSIDNLVHINDDIWETSHYAEYNVESMTSGIAHTFFELHSEQIQHQCEMIASVVDALIAAVTVTAIAVVPEAFLVADEAGVDAAESGAIRSSSLGTRFDMNGGGSRMWQRLVKKDRRGTIGKVFAQFQGLELTDLKSSLCARWGNPSPGDEDKHKRQLDIGIATAAHHFQVEIESRVKDIVSGVGFGDNGNFNPNDESVLADLISTGDYIELPDRFSNSPSLLEEQMTRHFQNAVISASLKSQSCYLRCQQPAGARSTMKGPGTFVVKDGVVCEAKCQRGSKTHPRNVEMFGIKEFQQRDLYWGNKMNHFVQASWIRWQKYGFRETGPFPSLDDLVHDRDSPSSASGSFLPVCYQPNAELAVVKDGHIQLPCACGTNGEYTVQFFHEIGQEKVLYESTDHADNCRARLRDVSPVSHFLTFCEMGWHYPRRHGQVHMRKGADPNCDAMKKEVASRDLKEPALSFYICDKSEIGAFIKHTQRHHWFSSLCRSYCK